MVELTAFRAIGFCAAAGGADFRSAFPLVLRHVGAPSCRGFGPSLVEDQLAHVVGDVGEADFDFGPRDADGPDLHPHAVFLIGEDVFDQAADFRLRRIAATDRRRHRPALRLPAMDVRDDAVLGEPGLIRHRAIGAVRPDAGRENVLPDKVFQELR